MVGCFFYKSALMVLLDVRVKSTHLPSKYIIKTKTHLDYYMTLFPESNQLINMTIQQLKHEAVALVGKKKNQPVLVYLHKHWHLLSIGSVVDDKFHPKRGISNINLMSSARARKYITQELNYCKLVPLALVFPHFEDELAAKVLPSAEDYRSLFQRELVTIAGGFTTDTLQEASLIKNDIDTLIGHLEVIMKNGPQGPFLHFERYYTVIIRDDDRAI